MASIESIANDIKAILQDVKTNTKDTKDNTAATANNVAQLNLTSQAGFSNLAAGMAVQITLLQQSNQLLYINEKQNQVIICWLRNIAEELCKILYLTKDEVALQTDMKKTLHHLDQIMELVHAREAMEVMKTDALQQKTEECCPPEKPKREPCYKECEIIQLPEHKQIDINWKPVQYQKS